MPLSVADSSKEYKIVRVGGRDKIRNHLHSLGFSTGEKINLISSNDGDVIVNIKDSRIAISRQMASKIYV